MKKENWVWMPHAGHLIIGDLCRFHLSTYVGGYIVSTVGEYMPDKVCRDIEVKVKGDKPLPKGDAGETEYFKRYGFKEIGAGRTYETMVFKAKKGKEKCCPYSVTSWTDIDFDGYNSPEEAYKGHLKLCKKWSKHG